jgi:peroxiredoxin
MKKLIHIFLLLIPALIRSQNSIGISYQEALDNCQKIVEENKKLSPDKFIYTGPECLIGASVPEFSATTFDGKEITAEYFKGKITILSFWSISCPPCIAEIPGFNNVVDKYGPDKLNYLAIAPDDEKDIKDFLIKNPWKFSQLSSGWTLNFDIFKHRWGYPTTFVINEDAIIIAAFSGGKPDERAVKEIDDTLTGIISVALK